MYYGESGLLGSGGVDVADRTGCDLTEKSHGL